MKILELFAGSCSFSNIAKEMGHKTFTTDIRQFGNIDLIKNIEILSPEDIPFIPDIIWASPPCTTFSIASIGTHWNKNRTPKTEQAKKALQIIRKTLSIIKYYQEQNPNLKYFIENPVGMLRKFNIMSTEPSVFNEKIIEIPIRHTLTYCQYGDKRMKPTDIWTNEDRWKPRKRCHNGDTCHEPAPRGSKTGTQGLANNYERSKVPEELCREILDWRQ